MVNGGDRPAKPRCVLDVLRRVERGATSKDDADYLLEVLNRAGAHIGTLEAQVVQLQRRLATVH